MVPINGERVAEIVRHAATALNFSGIAVYLWRDREHSLAGTPAAYEQKRLASLLWLGCWMLSITADAVARITEKGFKPGDMIWLMLAAGIAWMFKTYWKEYWQLGKKTVAPAPDNH